MGRDQEHTQVLLLASPPPQNQGERGQLPPCNLNTQIGPRAPQASGMQQLHEKPHGGSDSTALLSHAPSRRKNTHRTHSCLNLQACNPTHVLPARRRGGGPASDLLSFVAGSADLYAEFCEQAEAVIRVWHHLCLTPLLTSPQPPIPARVLPIFAGAGARTLWPRPACEHRKFSASAGNCRLSRSGFWPGKGFTCSLGWTLYLPRGVCCSQHAQSRAAHSSPYSLGFFFIFIFHSQASWVWVRHRADLESKALKIQMRTPRADLIGKYYGKHGHARLLKQALKHTGFHLEV